MTKQCKEFKLFDVVVTVNTSAGKSYVEDWASRNATEAEQYAAETSCCGDVASVIFENAREHKKLMYKNGVAGVE